MRWIAVLRHIFFPSKCIFCGRVVEAGGYVCSDCKRTLPYAGGELCPRCASSACRCHRRPPVYDRAVVPFYYERRAAEAIKRFKFGDRPQDAVGLSAFIAERLSQADDIPMPDVIIPVPMYRKNKAERGYNQSELLAKELSRRLQIHTDFYSFQKLRPSRTQHQLSAAERRQNLSDCFAVTVPGAICGKKILLVDDVITTGATLDACASILRQSGAQYIIAAAVCTTGCRK